MENKIHLSAGFGSFLQSVRMVVFPFLLATPAVLLWNFLHKRGWCSPSLSADEPIVNAILPGILVVHALIASFLFSKGTDDLRELNHAVRTDDRQKFLRIAEMRTPTPVKFLLFVSALVVMGWTMVLHYEQYFTGFASVYSVGYMLSLIWEIVSDFDDPVRGMWIVKDVPKGWVRDANIKKRVSDRLFEYLGRFFK